MRAEALPAPLGAHAPALAADFWFPTPSTGAARPTRGRVSVVQFLGGCCPAMFDESQAQGGLHAVDFAVLRRLVARFPEVEVVLVSETKGHEWYALMPSAREEAEWFHALIEAEHPPPGATLGIATTQFWRLPAPDSRRIAMPVANDTAYSFGKRVAVSGSSTFLLDQEGLLVEYDNGLNGIDETKLGHIIQTLLQRQAGSGKPAAPPAAPGRSHE
jgi:hypothetical protein